MLDVNDVGAVQGELIRGERRGDDTRHGEHLDAAECLRQIHVASTDA